jgi:hypothetical protein
MIIHTNIFSICFSWYTYTLTGLGVLTAVNMNCSVLWDTVPCSLLKVNQRVESQEF